MIFLSTVVTIIAMRLILKTVKRLNQANPILNVDKKIMIIHGVVLVFLTLSVVVNSLPPRSIKNKSYFIGLSLILVLLDLAT
jgi:hypothetical protein